MTGTAKDDQLRGAWSLAAIVELDHADRIQCQCKGCGQTVFKRVHVILFANGEIECWGSSCFAKELGAERRTVEPLYTGLGGRRLTEQEREWLRGNRDRLIAAFRAEKEREILAIAERSAQERAETERLTEHECERIAQAARAFAQERQVSKPLDFPRNSRLPSKQPPVRFSPEPMDDPLYREIRDRIAALWTAQGLDIERPGQRIMFLENVRGEYARRSGTS